MFRKGRGYKKEGLLDVQICINIAIKWIVVTYKANLGTLSEKNYGIIWEFFPIGGPPPIPPFWEPLIQKKIYRLFCILDP